MKGHNFLISSCFDTQDKLVEARPHENEESEKEDGAEGEKEEVHKSLGLETNHVCVPHIQ